MLEEQLDATVFGHTAPLNGKSFKQADLWSAPGNLADRCAVCTRSGACRALRVGGQEFARQHYQYAFKVSGSRTTANVLRRLGRWSTRIE